ncbi:hypothetical protein CNEO4_700003 [Clostridium neonatale]|nr:hypothetical protein CNEO4_700003 [Clostridium neonatale]
MPSRIAVFPSRKRKVIIKPIKTNIQSEAIFTLEKGRLNLSHTDNCNPSGALGTISITIYKVAPTAQIIILKIKTRN